MSVVLQRLTALENAHAKGDKDGVADHVEALVRYALEGPPAPDADAVAREAAILEVARAKPPSDADALTTVRKALGVREAPVEQAAGDIDGALPDALLSAKGQGGAVLSAGTTCLLAGAGGSAKTALALHVALGVAMAPESQRTALHGNVFQGMGGVVLYASWEDKPPVLAWRLRALAPQTGGGWTAHEALRKRVFILDMSGRPLFGPDLAARGGSYNARPEALAGWRTLWDAAKRREARLVVIDPVLAAYVGNSNDAAPVREFLNAVAEEAEALRCGVLLVAHSTKEARRGKSDPYDPGQVGGSGHWVDGVRGVLTLTQKKGKRRLSIAKANYGVSYVGIGLNALTADSGAVVGFNAAGEWAYGSDEDDEDNDGASKKGGGNGKADNRNRLENL